MSSTKTHTSRQARRHDSHRSAAEGFPSHSRRDRPKNHNSTGAERFNNGDGYDHSGGYPPIPYSSQSHNYEQTGNYYNQGYNHQHNGDFYDQNYSQQQTGEYDQHPSEGQDSRSGYPAGAGPSLELPQEIPELSTSPSISSGSSIDTWAPPYQPPFHPISGAGIGLGHQYHDAGQHGNIHPAHMGNAGQLGSDHADLEHIGASFADMNLTPKYTSRVEPEPDSYDPPPSGEVPTWNATEYHFPNAMVGSDPYGGAYSNGNQPAYDDPTVNRPDEGTYYTISDEVDDIFAEAEKDVTAYDWTKAVGAKPAATSKVARAVKVLRYSEGINEKHITALLDAIRKKQAKAHSNHSSTKTSHSYPKSGRKHTESRQRKY